MHDFANLERELRAFMAEYGTNPGILPTQGELNAAGRRDLANAIGRHGGVTPVAAQMGLVTARVPYRYRLDLANVERELLAFIEDHGTTGVMPTQHELVVAGRSDLTNAIRRSGGFTEVAERLGLAPTNGRHPQGYWDDRERVAAELRAFALEAGRPGEVPTERQLVQARRYDLKYAAQRHGGVRRVRMQ